MIENFYRGKTAIVTGASSGIGREIARELARWGSNVVITARRTERLTQLTEECNKLEGKCLPFSADIKDADAYKRIVDFALAINGRIDLLINNAALGLNAPTSELNAESTREIIETNLLGTIGLTQQVLRSMIKAQTGHLVFVTSLAGKMGFPGLSVYSASKFGIEGFAEAVRSEVSNFGIGVTVFRPGVTDTEFFDVAGMQNFSASMRKKGKIHSPTTVAKFLVDNLPNKANELTFGRDRLFLRLLPFIPHGLRLKLLSLLG